MKRPDSFSLSGIECAFGLRELGFALVSREAGRSVLRRGDHVIVVPDVLTLPMEVLDEILTRAEVSYEALVRAVGMVTTQPELPPLP